MKHTKRKLLSLAMLSLLPLVSVAQLTLERCHTLAQENYPMIKQYALIEQSTNYTLSNLSKGYLPRLGLSAQATYQSDVMTYPEALEKMLSQSGNNVLGITKDQYRIALELNQILWDGGNISAQKRVARGEGEVREAQTDVRMHELGQRVNDLFFGLLLLEDKIALNGEVQTLLLANIEKMQALETGGIAMRSDVDALRAEYLSTRQTEKELVHTRQSLRQMLGLFIGKEAHEVEELQRPQAQEPAHMHNNRPELRMYEAQLLQTQAQRKLLNSTLHPRLSLFAQGFYGYPGLNMFEDMFSHRMGWDGMVGVKLAWDISNLYTHKNSHCQLDIATSNIENMREVFLFNNSLESTQETEEIAKYKDLLADDEEIIRLRTSIRQSEEKKLEHGVIDVNNLLQEITRENRARLERSTHEIEMLRAIYELRNTLNQ